MLVLSVAWYQGGLHRGDGAEPSRGVQWLTAGPAGSSALDQLRAAPGCSLPPQQPRPGLTGWQGSARGAEPNSCRAPATIQRAGSIPPHRV